MSQQTDLANALICAFIGLAAGFLLGVVLTAVTVADSALPCPPFADERPVAILFLAPQTEEDLEWLRECGFMGEER